MNNIKKYNLIEVSILKVFHWNNSYFSITFDYRDIEFTPGQYIELYCNYNDKIIKRAYSIVNKVGGYLEIYIKYIEDGIATNFLKNIKIGDKILVNPKAKGNFVINNSYIGDRLFMIGFGSGIAPILSIASSGIEKRFNQVFVVNCFRFEENIPYLDLLKSLNNISNKIHNILCITNYYNSIDIKDMNTKEFFIYQGRFIDFLQNGIFESKFGLLSKDKDLIMLCGKINPVRSLLNWLRNYKGFKKYNGIDGGILAEAY